MTKSSELDTAIELLEWHMSEYADDKDWIGWRDAVTALKDYEKVKAEEEKWRDEWGKQLRRGDRLADAWVGLKLQCEKAEAELAALKAEMEKDEAFYAKMERIKFKEDSAEAALACQSTPQTDPKAGDVGQEGEN